MAHDPGDRFVVLHALRVRTLSSVEGIADATGVEAATVEQVLHGLADAGVAERREGARAGWVLTRAGRAHHADWSTSDLRESGAAAPIEAAYRRFLDLNQQVLATCAAWQLRDDGSNAPNDHADPAYDARVIARLVQLHVAALPVLAALTSTMTRFGRYGARLRRAVDHVVAGEVDWFTRPTVDSFHSVWFELHEDLLRTLGIERGSEVLDG